MAQEGIERVNELLARFARVDPAARDQPR